MREVWRDIPLLTLVARKQGLSPVHVVAGTHFPTMERAQKEAKELNKAYRGTEIKFVVRKEGWNRKRWYS
jgi:hypothetical protein